MKKHSRSNSMLYMLERTVRQFRLDLQQFLNAVVADITVEQWMLLSEISLHSGIGNLDLAKRLAKDPAAVSRSCELLVEKKLIKTQDHKTDSRKKMILITPKGQQLLNKCEKEVERFRKNVTKGISQDELNQVASTLDKLFYNSGGVEVTSH
jgi:DNA-binding MarR family transcriptional regulator